MNILHTKKFRYGSVSLALTVVIIAAVILINAIFTALSEKFLWYVDMTSEQIYSLTDDAKALLDTMDKSQEAEVIFCSDKDVLEANATQRFVLYTVLDIVEYCENVSVRYVDTVTNPSAVNKYKDDTGEPITSQSVIIASGSEGRVYTLSSLFTTDKNTGEVIGYNGEQRLVSGLLAVTQLEKPVACITTNHGESQSPNLEPLANLLYETGYDIELIDLMAQDIPDTCRLLVVFDPQSDFKVKDDISDIDELAKIDAFLDDRNSMMVFFDNETPVQKIPRFLELLDEWGIAIAHQPYYNEAGVLENTANLLVKDEKHSFDSQSRHNIIASYVEGGLGAQITSKLTDEKVPKSVVFPYSTVIRSTYQDIYDTSLTGGYYMNGVDRTSYDVFTSSSDAVALADGVELSGSQVEALGVHNPSKLPFSLMKITRQNFFDSETGNATYAHVLACASTGFTSEAALDSSYGNHAVLAYACSIMGREIVAVSLDCKYFGDTEINNVTAADANQYTIVLTVVPATIIFIAGVYIMVRRKYA